MNVRDPFNIRNGSLNRPPIATWKSSRGSNPPFNNPNHNLSPLHHIIRTAATATQSAAADLRDKASEAVQSAQHALAEAAAAAAAAATTTLDDDVEAGQKKKTDDSLPPKDKDNDMSSFAVPKHVPSFTNPQRQLEDHLWAASSSSSSSRQRSSGATTAASIVGGVQDLLSPNNHRRGGAALPMYKDKPYMYPPGRDGWRQRPLYRRKRTCGVLVLVVVVGLVWWTGLFAGHQGRAVTKLNQWGWLNQEAGESGGAGRGRGKVDWLKRRERVVEAMELSWDAYERYAWGYDEFHPESKKGRHMAPKGLGWIIIDSLDTLMLMNMTSRLTHAREWLSKSLTWDQDQDVNTFETTIRMLGGLLSAHYLSTEYPNLAPIPDDKLGTLGEDLYLEKAKDLADRLMAAFDSPSGVPYASVNLAKYKGIISHADMGASSTAETTTLQLEFKYLAKLTGEKEFWDRAEKVMKLVDDNGARDGLVPIFIFATTGKFQGENIRLGSRGDSYYEYLIKQYLQTNEKEPVYREMWREAMQGVRKHLITYTEPSQFTIIGERPSGLGGELSPKMDHLVCFMPGTIALAATGGLTEKEARKLPTWTKQDDADMQLARELMHTCWGMYEWMATGLAGEITYFNIGKPPLPESAPHQAPAEFDPAPDAEWRKAYDVRAFDSHNLQRPETVESLFYMWRITGETKYRDWGWAMFKSFMNYTAVADGGGFTSLTNANKIPPTSRDNMESFWLAETLKYLYLLFSPDDLLPLDKVVLNTEAHPLPRFDMGPLFSTGWTRKARDGEGKIVRPEATMADFRPKEEGGSSFAQGSVLSMRGASSYYSRQEQEQDREHAGRPVRRWLDSFRRDPGRHVTPASVMNTAEDRHRASMVGTRRSRDDSAPPQERGRSREPRQGGGGGHYFDMHAANVGTANSLLSRELKGRHLQMIAIGGSIGTGLFVASGKALNTGGPAAVLIAYLFVGCMLYCTIQALGELAVTFPVAGSFSAYSTRFLDPAWGFAMGWNYALQWLVVLPLEIIAASITVSYWNPNLNRAIFITVFLLAIVVINLFGVKGYGEAEFVFAIIKITAVIGFILLGIVINIGGFPDDGYIGGRYWHDPGAFNNGFKGLCAVFVTAAFAFTGTELVGLAAAETQNPRRSLPTAIKQVFWRITLFYVASLTLVGLLVPHNHPRLLGAKSAADASASPFVIAIESAGIAILPGVMNSVILVAVISVGNSAVFGSSRTLAALADQRQAPPILGYVDRRGRPLVAIVVASLVGLLGYLADLDQQSDVLNWLLAVSGLSSIFTWGSICLAHIRFRRAWAARGRSPRHLAFRSQVGVAGSWLGLALNVLVLLAQFWTAAWPIPSPLPSAPKGGAYTPPLSSAPGGVNEGAGGAAAEPIHSARDAAQNFFLQYLCAPIVAAFYVGYKLWFRTRVVRIDEIDVDTGRRDFNLPILISREVDERRGMPRWKRVYKFLC
ncbi:glycoside hydrolase [Chaetomidium leptoderma]|uniref:alpha-1,2-Mannosidase n=1 Tax=Chaetomidium leptoderma TaxID=669021 RepID=A0AAN7A213_9PEZI|nr:glycoside hydrolase [Chaetomidium leptoderma]